MNPRAGLRAAQMLWVCGIIGALLATGVGLMVQLMQTPPPPGSAATASSQWPIPMLFAALAVFTLIEAIVLGAVIPSVLRKKARQAWAKRSDDLTALKGIATMYVTAAIVRVSLIVMPAGMLCAGLVMELPAWWGLLIVPVLITLGFYQPKQAKMERFIAEATGMTVRSAGPEDPYPVGPR